MLFLSLICSGSVVLLSVFAWDILTRSVFSMTRSMAGLLNEERDYLLQLEFVHTDTIIP
jgi:hypothetical protein